MAEGDRQLAFTTGPVPTSVQVSGADRITPKTVNASFDGSGAAGAFLPCLILTGRTGHEVARIPAPQVAAGASAEVSWFPRPGVVSAGGGGGAGPVEYFHEFAGPHVANLAWTQLNWAHDSGASLLDLTNPLVPAFKAAGVYSVTACARDQSPFSWPGFLGLWLKFNNELEDHASITMSDADTVSGILFKVPQVTVTETRTVAAGDTVQALASHNQGGPVQVNLTHAVVQQVN